MANEYSATGLTIVTATGLMQTDWRFGAGSMRDGKEEIKGQTNCASAKPFRSQSHLLRFPTLQAKIELFLTVLTRWCKIT